MCFLNKNATKYLFLMNLQSLKNWYLQNFYAENYLFEFFVLLTLIGA